MACVTSYIFTFVCGYYRKCDSVCRRRVRVIIHSLCVDFVCLVWSNHFASIYHIIIIFLPPAIGIVYAVIFVSMPAAFGAKALQRFFGVMAVHGTAQNAAEDCRLQCLPPLALQMYNLFSSFLIFFDLLYA